MQHQAACYALENNIFLNLRLFDTSLKACSSTSYFVDDLKLKKCLYVEVTLNLCTS